MYEEFLPIALILVCAKLFGMGSRKIFLPQVVGMLVAGIFLKICGITTGPFIAEIAEFGVIMIMFTAGLETNIEDVKNTGFASLVVASLGVLVPLAGGFVLYSLMHGGFAPIGSPEFISAVFTGLIITATSVSITVDALREMGKLHTKAGTIILSAAIIDDVIGVLLLSIVLGLRNPDVHPWMVLVKTVTFFGIVAVSGVIAHYIFKWLGKRYPHNRRVPIFGLVFCLLLSYIAEKWFGIADITGAFLAGIVLCNLRSAKYIVEKIDTSAYMFFAPIFFVNIGLKTDFSGFSGKILIFAILFVIVALLTKIIGCGIGAKLCKYSNKEALRIGVGMMARGEVCLIIAQKGLSMGLFEASYFPAIISLVIVASISTPIILKLLYKNKKEAPLENSI
ncbi:MAG: cation:proton antiporter [Clostridia bacterium]|nr:cation:proton antiporter [Clostridia bacterium]